MIAITTFIAACAIGVETGWQPIEEDQLEYIIRIEPQLIEAMRDGESVVSEIPPQLRGVRRYRIVVGDADTDGGPLPRINLPPMSSEPPDKDPEADGQRSNRGDPLKQAADVDRSRKLLEPNLLDVDEGGVQRATAELASKSAKEDVTGDPSERAENERLDLTAGDGPSSNGPSSNGPIVTAKPWWPLSLALVGLFVSLGGNVYLTWITLNIRGRYRTLLNKSADHLIHGGPEQTTK